MICSKTKHKIEWSVKPPALCTSHLVSFVYESFSEELDLTPMLAPEKGLFGV